MFSYSATGELKIQKKNLIEGFNNIEHLQYPLPNVNNITANNNVNNITANNNPLIVGSNDTYNVDKESPIKEEQRKFQIEEEQRTFQIEEESRIYGKQNDKIANSIRNKEQNSEIPIGDKPNPYSNLNIHFDSSIKPVDPSVIDTDVDLKKIISDFENLITSCQVPFELATNIYKDTFDEDGNLHIKKYKRMLEQLDDIISNKKYLKNFVKENNLTNSGKKQLICILNTYDKYIPNTSELKELTEKKIIKINNLKDDKSDDEIDNIVVNRYCINNKCLTKEEIINLYNHIN